MKQGKLNVLTMLLPVLLVGCDILEVDNMDPPSSLLTGRVVVNGEPLGVRNPTGSAQILLWQTDWDVGNPNRISSSIPVYLNPAGDFQALLYDGEYEVEVVNNQGPWQNVGTRTPISVRGATNVDVEVSPYYTIQNETITYNATPAPGGSITATFNVGKHVTTPAVERVGVFVNTTTFVDRTRRTAFLERTASQIQTQLNTNGTITITVNLPANIHVTPSPDPREAVYVRIGVKAVGVTELAYTQVYKVDI